MFVSSFFLLLISTIVIHAAQLPNFIKKCDKNDPNFGECGIAVSRVVIPRLVTGYKELGFPPISPFHVDEIGIEATESLKLKLTDVDIYGLEKGNITDMKCDFKIGSCSTSIYFPQLEVKGTYDIDGQVLILPIKGHGGASIKIDDAVFDFTLAWSLYKKDGVEYATPGEFVLHYNTNRSFYHFDNLFNGDKALGDQMNNFLNENWQDLSKEVEPAVSRTISVILKTMFSRLSDQIPYNDLFL
ncbi:PREDICTED: protein takeout-like [Nicrophorus vespilloides]|uniref:Protein takeout-like n=1 Tax=Nicrophorus vespilloides TaxID=110193 RepID=A0ABM1MV53_NICVS|nr:PREDICTED: protein takeout-like [Nicrophorus vespilloides]